MKFLKSILITASFLLGALFAIGSYIAIVFEFDGFGSSSDQPRLWYIALLLLALLVCIVGPFVVTRVVSKKVISRWAWAIAIASVLIVFVSLGLRFN